MTLGLNGSLLVIWGCTPAAVDSRAVDFQDSQGDTALGTASDTASDTAADSALDTAGEIAPEPLTGMWVWDTSVAGNPAATAELLTFSATNGVDTLFLSCDPVGYQISGAVGNYTQFISAAHAENIEVYAVTGYSWFSVPCDAGLVGQTTCWTEGWDVYQNCAESGAGFDGIMDDTEPASTPDGSWFTEYEQRAGWHLQYLQGIRDRIGTLPFHHAIPSWYDDSPPLSLDESGTFATLDIWIAQTVDVMGVMSYRDSAADILPLASGELSRGSIWIGLETAPTSEGEHLTFAEEGSEALNEALSELTNEIGADPNLHGFMIDAYESWRLLP